MPVRLFFFFNTGDNLSKSFWMILPFLSLFNHPPSIILLITTPYHTFIFRHPVHKAAILYSVLLIISLKPLLLQVLRPRLQRAALFYLTKLKKGVKKEEKQQASHTVISPKALEFSAF